MTIISEETKQQRIYSEALDQSLQAAISRMTGGISPAALLLAFYDWQLHLAIHPAKQMELINLFEENFLHLARNISVT